MLIRGINSLHFKNRLFKAFCFVDQSLLIVDNTNMMYFKKAMKYKKQFYCDQKIKPNNYKQLIFNYLNQKQPLNSA